VFVDGATLALDGASGEVIVAPSGARIARMQAAADAATARRDELRARRDLATVTRDGHTMTLVANASTPEEARLAAEWGAAGVGLLRTELLFLERSTLPSEDEQLALYRAVAAELPGKPIVVRTLDVGGDKKLPAFPLPQEENPSEPTT
jgi:phosphotransferase system enzyme I (PtsI)